jgi:hypothetical protein
MYISRSIVVNASAKEVWNTVKGPEGWAEWHPDIRAVEPVDFEDKNLLRVVFEDGDSVIERSIGTDGLSFGYEVIAGQASMTGYQGSVTIIENEMQSVVVWNVSFEPLAAGRYEAIAVGFMEVGLTALAQRYEK